MMQRAAVLGSPVAHSLSPALHRAAYEAMGLDAQYDAIEVSRDELRSFVEGCGPQWLGLSLTMPLKTEAVRVATTVDGLAATLNAANTLIPIDGGWRAENTDVAGIVHAIGPIAVRSAVVLGAGASARSALAALSQLGVRDVVMAARRVEAASQNAELAAEFDIALHPIALNDEFELADVELCVSTLPPHAADDVQVDGFVGTLLDIAYDPWPSVLATAWLQHGGRVIPGHEMLLFQAAEQVRLMTGRDPNVEAMRLGLEAALAARA